jgi:anion-transporting  ArsA/GET3 family ATPase
MTDERTDDYIMCDTPEKIQLFRLLALKASLKVEIKTGMRRRGRSSYAIIKEEFAFTGGKKKVLQQFENFLKETYNMEEE